MAVDKLKIMAVDDNPGHLINLKMLEGNERPAALVAERTAEMEQANQSLLPSRNETLELLENLKLENAARRQSEEDLKKAQEFAKVGQWSHDLKIGKVQWSWLVYKALGLEVGDPNIDKDNLFFKSVHPDDR